MKALVGRTVKATFSNLVRDFTLLPHLKPDQAKRQQAAQFCTALGRGHLIRRQGVGAFHRSASRRQGFPY
jgi:hypothetical protein